MMRRVALASAMLIGLVSACGANPPVARDQVKAGDASTGQASQSQASGTSVSIASPGGPPPAASPPGTAAPTTSLPSEDLSLLPKVDLAYAMRPPLDVLVAFNNANADAIQKCFGTHGVNFRPTVRSQQDELAEDSRHLHSFLFDDMTLIATQGYGWRIGPGPTGVAADTAPAAAVADKITPPCPVQAAQSVGDAVPIATFQVEQGKLVEQFLADSTMAGPRQAWATCMAAAGRPDIKSFAELPRPGALPLDKEIGLATTDAGCRQTSGYDGAMVKWFTENVASWLAAHPKQVADVAQQSAHMREAAVAAGTLTSTR